MPLLSVLAGRLIARARLRRGFGYGIVDRLESKRGLQGGVSGCFTG